MTFLNHNNNLLILTLYFPLPPSLVASPAGSAPLPAAEATKPITSDKISEDIKSLEEQINTLNTLKTKQYEYLNEEDSKRLSDCHSKLSALQTVNKLAEFADELDTTKTNSNNILNNLCSGLEKFLGFNSTSKGYTGQGIVYSDLDRLCDGVMGFLSGVLGAVKNENEVTTYDNYMTKKLNEVLKEVNNKIGSGRDGLVDAVGAVKGWLEGYEGEVNNKMTAVTNALNNLSGKLINGSHVAAGKNYYQDVSSQAPAPLADQLRSWTQTLAQIEADISSVEDNNVNVLDSALNEKLMHEIKVVKSAVGMLKEPAGNSELIKQVRKVDGTIDSHFLKILEAIGKLEHEKTQRFGTVKLALKEVNESLLQLNERHKDITLAAFDHIKWQIKDLDNTENPSQGNNKSKVMKDADAIRTALTLVGDQLQGCVYELGRWISRNIKFLESAQKYVQSIINIAKGGTGSRKDLIIHFVGEICKKLEPLGEFVQHRIKDTVAMSVEEAKRKISPLEDAYKLKLFSIKKEVEGAVGDVKKAIEVLSGDFELTKDTNIKGILAHINVEVEKILKGEGESKDKGLAGIENAIKEYATSFTANHFGEKVLKRWVHDIIREEDGNVKQNLQKYLSAPHNKGPGNLLEDSINSPHDAIKSTTIDKITTAFRAELDGKITTPRNTIAELGEHMDDNIEKVKNLCNEFASTLTQRLTQDETSSGGALSSKIIKQIEDTLGVTHSGVTADGYHNQHLEWAVRGILKAIITKSKQVITELVWFTGLKAKLGTDSSIAKELEAAKIKTSSLLAKVHAAVISSSIVTVPAGNVDQAIAKISKTVEGITGDSGSVNVQGLEFYGHTEARANINTALEDVKKSVDGFNIDATKKDLDTISSEIREKLTALTKTVARTGEGIHKYLDDIKMEQIAGQLKKIQEDIESVKLQQMSDHVGRIQQAIDVVCNTIAYLEMAPSEIDKKRSEVKDLIRQFRRQVEDKFSLIQTDVTNAETFIQITIDALEIVVRKAHTVITTQVRSLFAEQHKADLEALHKCVEKQLAAVKEIIDKDSRTGIKGLLKTVNGSSFTLDSKGIPKFTDSTSPTLLTQLETALPKRANPAEPDPGHAANFQNAVVKIKDYTNRILVYTWNDMETSLVSQLSTRHAYKTKVEDIKKALNNMIDHICDSKHFDHEFVKLHEHFDGILRHLSPQDFSALPYPLLAPLKAGLAKFAEQLGHAYVNRYSGRKMGELTKVKPVETSKAPAGKPQTPKEPDYDVTPEGRNCAKVCLTIVEMVRSAMMKFHKKCSSTDGDWRDLKISEKNKKPINEFGHFLTECGFTIPRGDGSKQEGELRCSSKMTGEEICKQLITVKPILDHNTHFKKCSSKSEGTVKSDLMGILKCLYTHINEYNEVCHLSALKSTKRPCSVYEMLLWLSGLPHHPVHTAMRDERILEVIEEINEVDKENVENTETTHKDAILFSVVDTDSISLEAYPRKASYEHMRTAVTHICSTSYDILCTIAGHGDEYTVYASDYSNNSIKLHYPASGEDCLDMFLDILRRMLPTLCFLKSQCSLTTENRGWSDCQYGMNTAPAKWPCIEHSSDKATSQPTKQPKCQPTSPLMSYLNDCLPGHLPHQLSKVGCKYECATCPATSKKGMPCITPLGFRGFSGSTKTGKDLRKVLTKFLDNVYISCLFTLMPKPPTTLPEHLGFALSLAQYINSRQPFNNRIDTFAYAFESCIKVTSVGLYKDPYELTKSIVHAYGSDALKHSECESYHLRNLTINGMCRLSKDQIRCVPYVSSLGNYSYEVVAHKHVGLYLSWAVYLPWTLWQLLKNLYDDFSNIYCQDWGCQMCLRADTCKRGQHGLRDDKTKYDNCHCSSIVECKGAMPTLCKYGFTFGSAATLNEQDRKKKCADFMEQFNNVLQSTYFQTLFEKCDDFLFKIRAPFIWLTIALWSLSLFYLICVMVGRLDVLHIRSHLRIPSSHKITAQSLLAAAQVGRLAKISYLQP